MPIEKPEDQNHMAQPPTQDQLLVLQEQFSAAKLKIAALETLIDLAEENLQIDIRKKSGTRQSAK
jgi:transposase